MSLRATRRQFLQFLPRSVALSALIAAERLQAMESRRQANDQFLGTVPLSRPGAVPLERLIGSGLDARLFTDLSTLTSGGLITPVGRFYIRTACPEAARAAGAWSIRVGGLDCIN